MKKYFLLFILFYVNQIVFAQSTVLQSSTPASENLSAERLQRIDNILQQAIDSNWINGAIGFIARDSKIVYNKSFGWSDAEGKIKMQNDNIFRIASQTKAITSVAVMILFEQGKLLLDDPISKYMPAFAHPKILNTFNEKDTTYTTIDAKKEITIRNLLTHTSGIDYAQIGSDKMNAIYAKAGIPAGFVSDKLVLGNEINKLAKLPLINEPGEKFTYSLSVDVLGYLVEVLSGMSLSDFMYKNIFQPLGMNDTYFYLPASKFSRLVPVYTENKNHHLIKWNNDTTFKHVSADYPKVNGTYFSGGAGLSSTIKDYATFLQMMLNGGEYNGHRILAKRTVELMTMNQMGDLNLGDNKFGLGFEVVTKKGEAKIGESEGSFGWGGFFGTSYWADPREHLVGLLFIQQWPLTHGEIADKFRALVYAALSD